jgi:hypothetical protein
MSVGIRQRVEKNLRPMPQSPTAHPLVIYRWHCRQPISVGILQRVLKYLRPMPPSPTDWPSVIYRWKYRWNTSVNKVLAREIFYGCAFLVCKTVGVCFFLTNIPMEVGITDDQYSDRHILSMRPSAKILPTNCVFYTDIIIPSVKLFNGGVV